MAVSKNERKKKCQQHDAAAILEFQLRRQATYTAVELRSLRLEVAQGSQ